METSALPISSSTFAKPKVQVFTLLKGIANIAKDATTGGWASLPADIIDTLSAIKPDSKPEHLGWQLISRSLADALLTLIAEANPIFLKEDIELQPLDDTLNEFLEKESYYVKSDFFNKPKSLKLLKDIKPTLKEYLQIFEFTAIEASNILQRLDSYFVFSLINEWRKHVDQYRVLSQVITTPFDEAENKESEWAVYSNYLQNQIQKPVFSETFCLEQVYIPLRAYYKVRTNKQEQEQAKMEGTLDDVKPEVKKIVVDIEKHLLGWMNKENKNDSIRIIQGGPGYGKSSFLKIFAARLAAEGKRVLFVPLHRLDVEDKLAASINNFLRYDKYLTHDPINESNEKLIVLFDGLDELSMQGKLLSEVAHSFLREVERSVTNFNNRSLKIQVIISGRDVVVQQNESDFRNDGQILRLLPYHLSDDDKKELVDVQDLLKEDQRHVWWKKYAKVNGKTYRGMPKALVTDDLDPITAQPLLNFLVALSFERKKINFNDTTNLNEIYYDLLCAIYERNYADGRKHQANCKMEQEHFCIILEEIALSAWHGKGRTTTVRDIREHFQNSGLEPLLNQFVNDAEKGVVSLLAAFYFRQAGVKAEGMQTFEFTHKSFGEYLTAKKIVRQVVFIHEQLEKNEKDLLKRDGRNSVSCLEDWIVLFSNKEPDLDLIKFISYELALFARKRRDLLKDLQVSIVKLINTMLLNGMPMEKLYSRIPTYKVANEYAVNAEKALFIIHSLLAHETNIVSEIDWPSETAYGEFLSKVKGQRNGGLLFILKCLNHIDASDSVLDIQDLYNSNMRCCDLSYSTFAYACMVRADLNDSVLNNINALKANFSTARMNRCNLNDADMSQVLAEFATLDDAKLNDTILAGANLTRASLIRANMENAILSRATLKETKFVEANLQGASLDKAILTNANCTRAKMVGVNLYGANLKSAILVRAEMQNCDLERADLRGANLTGANLSGAKLKGANLDGANLSRADLRGAEYNDLSGAILQDTKLD